MTMEETQRLYTAQVSYLNGYNKGLNQGFQDGSINQSYQQQDAFISLLIWDLLLFGNLAILMLVQAFIQNPLWHMLVSITTILLTARVVWAWITYRSFVGMN